MELISLIALVVFVGAFTQGLAGFGFAFFALPILSFFMDFKVAVVLLVILAQILNVMILWFHKVRPDWKLLLKLTVVTLPGIPVGVYMLRFFPVPFLQGSLGVTLILFAMYQWFFHPRPRELGKAWVAVAGFLAGVLGGSLNSQGPPIMLYAALQPWDKDKVKATLIGYFFVSGILVIIVQAAQGLMNMEIMRLSAWCLPVLLLGAFAGRLAYVRLGEGGYRHVFTALLLALGAMMIVRSSGVI